MENKEHKPAEHKIVSHAEHKIVHQKKSVWSVWKIAAAVLALLLIISIFTNGFSALSFGKKLSKEDVKAKTEKYVNLLVAGQATVAVKEVVDNGDLYRVKLDVGGKEYDSYVTKDGNLLFPQAVNMSVDLGQAAATDSQQAPAPQDLPKTDKPVVELFVMSYCPYGTQEEKGILPAIKALGSKVDFKVRFVYYAMHGEKEIKEQMNQYCIQKEQTDKYMSYLACFLNASDGAGCMKSAGVDSAKLSTCVAAMDKQYSIMANFNDKTKWLNGNYPLFNADADLNTKYGVGGSPTLVINGAEASSGRDSASLLKAICSSFNTAPAECQTQLSSASPSPGFGYGTAAAATAAGCGA